MASLPSQRKPKKAKRLHRVDSEQLDRLDSLPWNSSLPDNNNDNDDPFSILAGSNELEGGFLSLEEIDESKYAFEIPKIERGKLKEKQQQKVKSKKRKGEEVDSVADDEAVNDGSCKEAEKETEDKGEEENKEVKGKMKKKKKKKKNKKKKKKKKKDKSKVKTTEENVEAVVG